MYQYCCIDSIVKKIEADFTALIKCAWMGGDGAGAGGEGVECWKGTGLAPYRVSEMNGNYCILPFI